MTREKLFETAFRYKKAGLWKVLWDSELFAIKLKDDKIGYVSIMGKNGEYNGLGIYIGDEGFSSYRLLQNLDPYMLSEYKYRETVLQQNCLQVAFGSKEDLPPEELEETRIYAKEHGIRLSGKNAYPQFIKFDPGYFPWKVQTDDDMEALYEAMEASIMLAEVFTTTTPEVIGIIPVTPDETEVPLFERRGDQLHTIGLIPLPPIKEEKYEYIKATNDVAIAGLKKLKQQGIWEMEFIRMLEPVQNNPEEVPHYPALILAAEKESGYMLPVPLVEFAEKDPKKLLDEFAKAWKLQKIRPKEVRCRDERTFAMVKDFCEKIGSKVSIYTGEMPALDEAEEALMDKTLGQDPEEAISQLEKVIDEILGMSRSELNMIPQPMIDELKMLIEHEVFPEDIAKELKNKLKGI